MTKFKCITQQDHLTNFRAVSGMTYESVRGHYFKVKNKKDIKFFKKNKRFEEGGILDKNETSLDVDELLRNDLNEIGIDPKVIEYIVKVYHSKKALEDAVRATLVSGTALSPSIPEEQEILMRDWIMDDKVSEKEETQGSKDLPGVPNDITEEEAKQADKKQEVL